MYSDGYSEIHWNIYRESFYEIVVPLLKSLIMSFIKWDALRDLVQFAQFKKHKKHPWESVTFSKVAGFCYQSRCSSFINNFEQIPLISEKFSVNNFEQMFVPQRSCTTEVYSELCHLWWTFMGKIVNGFYLWKSNSRPPKMLVLFTSMRAFKNDEKFLYENFLMKNFFILS